MALSYINNKEIKFGSSKPLNGVYTPGSPTREYEPLDSLGIYLNSGIPLSYGVENNRYMSMSDEFAATSQGNSYSFNQLFAAQMILGFKLHDRFIACDTEHKIIGTEPLLQKAYLAEITEKTLDYFKIKIYGDKTRTYCIRMSSSEVPTSYIDLTNSFDENGLNLTQTDRLSFLSYYRFYPLTARDPSSRDEETLGVDYYLLPSAEGLKELSGDILSKFNAFISSDGTLTSLGNTAFAYAGDIDYVPNYRGETSEAAVSAAESARVILGQVEGIHAGINQLLPEMEENLELTKQYRDEAMSTEIGTVREDLNQLKGDLLNLSEFVIYNNIKDWKQGVTNGSEIIASVTRIYTPTMYPLKHFLNSDITIDQDYEYAICCYNKDGVGKDGHYIYLDIINQRLFSSVVWYNTTIHLYDYKDIIGEYSYIRFLMRKKDIPLDDTSNPITPDLGSMLTIVDKENKSEYLNYIAFNKGLKIVNPINKDSELWTQWNNRLAFGMIPTRARVPFNIDGQLYVNGTIIANNTASQNNNRWGFHVYEAYAKDNYSRMTMVLDKHNNEFDNKPTLEYYYYTGANHHAKSYGYTKIGSDVLYKSFLFSRDKMIAGGVIDCRFVLTLANISKTNDFNTTYETVEEADNAYEPENEAVENVRCMKYIYYKNATNGSLYYDKDTNHVMAKINGKWQELSYHAIGDIVMSSLSLVDFEIVHYGEWKLIKTESFNDPTGESQTINYYKRIE